jgi:hypothetical protein
VIEGNIVALFMHAGKVKCRVRNTTVGFVTMRKVVKQTGAPKNQLYFTMALNSE